MRFRPAEPNGLVDSDIVVASIGVAVIVVVVPVAVAGQHMVSVARTIFDDRRSAICACVDANDRRSVK